jgi:hypothetical protein
VNSKTSDRFWACFEKLPVDVQALAQEKYKLWREEPFNPALHFKELHPDLWSVRINLGYRAMARRNGELIVWFWIGTHAEYDRLISRR